MEPSHFEELKEQYLLDIKAAVEITDIPMGLIINLDHTGVNIVPGSQWTMEEKGVKQVECASLDDKCQIKIVVCATASGTFLYTISGNLSGYPYVLAKICLPR